METTDLEKLTEPQVEWLILADGAHAVGGKIYILGGGINHVQRPVADDGTPPLNFAICMSITIPWSRTNEKIAWMVRVVNEDDKDVTPLFRGDLEASRPVGLEQGATQRSMMAVNMSIPLDEAGVYTVITELPEVPSSSKRATIKVVDVPVRAQHAK